ncbi:endoribonuclease YBEY, chloroplastic isoform X2 [Dendrobium catenatum]|uniref:endoribonuclease YBEY, chloroplastic isoform X2 n=1 Tax=Dendrobium catenatum TaxID=906689 RepID=UPI0009F2C88D|nr:endoribonuclease YBEY, chloroplastic isoform X2 [Dendrobium catenatum]
MAIFFARALPLTSSRPSLSFGPLVAAALRQRPTASVDNLSLLLSSPTVMPLFSVSWPRRSYYISKPTLRPPIPPRGVGENVRGFRRGRWRRRPAARKKLRKERQPELVVRICIEEDLPDDPEIMNIAETLKLDVPMAMALAFSHLDVENFHTRDGSINDVSKFETVEVSLLLCNDYFIRKLNKDWRDEDHATDVLSMSQHIPEIDLPVLMLGDIVISIETALKQADERDHSLLDEVHGLLHLLGFDHEVSNLAEEEMEKEEELVLTTLGWKGKGLIKSAYDSISNGSHQAQALDETDRSIVEVDAFPCRQKISYIFCDMDGTLLNSKSQITLRTVEALNEAISRGVRIVIATGKSRSAVMRAFKTANLAGKGDIVNESSPGVFLQGLLVYGRKGREICRRNLDRNVCKEILLYSLEHSVPAVAFSEDRCFTVFDHPLVESLHEIYHEPKAEVIPAVEQILSSFEIQKLLFLDTAEGISSTLRPYWSAATRGQATVVQAVPDMLEIIPLGASKGNGVKLLLDHLGVSEKEVVAIGDGENDVEMLKMASLGIALANGSDKAKAAADVIGLTNDEDGVAEAIYKYVL